jgi:hypothetical protein
MDKVIAGNDESSTNNAAISLLRELWSGYTSRNKEPERFSAGPERGTYKLFRLLLALKREIALPKASAWLEPCAGDDNPCPTTDNMVEVRVEILRYRRRVKLSRWQLDFFLHEMRAEALFSNGHLDLNRLLQPEK